jgi:hypothetical protein
MKNVRVSEIRCKKERARAIAGLEQTRTEGSVWVSPDGLSVTVSPFDLSGPTGWHRVIR